MYILHFSFVLVFVGVFVLFCFPLIFKNLSVSIELFSFNYGENLPQNETKGFSLNCLSYLSTIQSVSWNLRMELYIFS